ncbi:MAG: carbohydrate ABC transporter permease [Acidimicrobiales bacterium]
MDKLIQMAVGVVASIGISAVIFVALNKGTDALPERIGRRVRPWVFVGPALLFLFVTLVVPTIRTVYLSLQDNGGEFLGLDNYGDIFTNDSFFSLNGLGDIFTSRLFFVGLALVLVSVFFARRSGRAVGGRLDFSDQLPLLALIGGIVLGLFAVFTSMRGVIWNNLWWVFAVTGISTGLGLAVAVLADRMKGEAIAKSLIFLPMAISFVGASVIWRFVYAFAPPSTDQFGLLNAVWVGLGGVPQAVLQDAPWNTFFLIIVLIWGQTGFAMVVLSASIKAVPDDLIEAARIDGANESQVFWRVTLPQIRTTVLVVVTTLVILVMKVFDIVKVMTNGEFGTNVIANEMYDQAFIFGAQGLGAALAVVLLVSVLPVIVYNVRQVGEEA